MRIFMILTLLLLAACGSGGGVEVGPSSYDVALLFVSGHEISIGSEHNKSYLHEEGDIGPFLVSQVRSVFPSTLAVYYRDGADSAETDGVVYGGSDAFLDDLGRGVAASRVCVIAHSHGGPRAMDMIRQLPSRFVHHMVLLDANSYGFDAGAHDDSGADEERIFGSSSMFHQHPVVASNTVLKPADDDRVGSDYLLHSLEQADIIPWNVWSCLEYRLREGAGSPGNPLDNALDRHWALRSDGSDVRITPRIALGDDHGSIHKPGESGTPAAVAAWLIGQLQTPISNGGFQHDRSNSLSDVASGGIVSADFNKDGRKDVALALSNGQVAVLSGASGSSALLGSPSYFFAGIEVSQMLAVDADRDDKVDLVLLGENEVQVWYGQGNGNFTDEITLDQWGSGFPVSVATADLTGDQYPDLVVLTDSSEIFSVEGGGESRSWGIPNSFGFLPGAPSEDVSGLALYMEDLDGDGVCDLLASNDGPTSLSNLFFVSGIPLGGGESTFSPGSAEQLLSSMNRGGHPLALRVADFDRDGRRDIVVMSGFAGEVVFLRNEGFGEFSEEEAWDGDWPFSHDALACTDLDGDGNLDMLLCFDSSIRVYADVFQGPENVSGFYTQGLAQFDSVVVGDFNGDGHLDFASAGGADNRLATYRGGVYDGPGSGDGGDLDEIIPKPRR